MFSFYSRYQELENQSVHKKCIVKIYKGKTIDNNKENKNTIKENEQKIK
jgi:hypothetical protein